jgi:hypothetical protein
MILVLLEWIREHDRAHFYHPLEEAKDGRSKCHISTQDMKEYQPLMETFP